MSSNIERQIRAETILLTYSEDGDEDAALNDLLADLFHYVGPQTLDRALMTARIHYAAENGEGAHHA